MTEKDKCVICGKENLERCFDGDRFKKDSIKEFNIDFESIYTDHWKGFYFVCYECYGKYNKNLQKDLVLKFLDLEEEYLENGSATWYQDGKLSVLRFLITTFKGMIKSPNTFDSSSKAFLDGVFKSIENIKKLVNS